MDPLVQAEISRLNPQQVYSDFEMRVTVEIEDWLLDQNDWMLKYGSYENAVKAFWKDKLN